MRFIGYKDGNVSYVGVLTPDGGIATVTDVDGFYADLDHWTAFARSRQTGDVALGQVLPAPPIASNARIFCVGLNYRAHAEESAMAVETHPTIFARWAQSLTTDGAEVAILDDQLDWEGELAVVMGASLADADEATARASVFGYAPFNDISARTYQRHTSQWAIGKNMDDSGPIGAIVTADEAGRPEDGWRLRTLLNGRTVQDGNTRDMIFGIGAVARYISQVMTIRPGDVIATGTPAGVGIGRTPPLYLKAGDTVAVEIDAIGRIENTIVEASRRRRVAA